MEHIDNLLLEKGIRPSFQRKMILEALLSKKWHPTVDDVFSALSKEHPTLSRTTVYNTLKLFSKLGLTKVVRIENDELRYDTDTREHSHFKCLHCGKIFDVFSPNVHFLSRTICASLPDGFLVKEVRTGIWGTCAVCRSSKTLR